jgi:hypothetical protein
MWDQQRKVRLQQNKSSRLTYGTFDCDSSSDNKYLCRSLGIKRTPTVKFFGAGNFYESNTGSYWNGVATYKGVYSSLMFKEVPGSNQPLVIKGLYYWVPIMHGISQLQLRWLQLLATFGLGKRYHSLPKHIKQLRGWIEARKNLNVDPSEVVESAEEAGKDSVVIRFKDYDNEDVVLISDDPDDLGCGLRNHRVDGDGALSDDSVTADSSSHDTASSVLHSELSGDQTTEAQQQAAAAVDAFAYLASIDYSSAAGRRALQCISKQADSFCNSSGSDRSQSEPYCRMLQQCIDSGFVAADCRPLQCPFEAAVGCVMTAWCLLPAVTELAGF